MHPMINEFKQKQRDGDKKELSWLGGSFLRKSSNQVYNSKQLAQLKNESQLALKSRLKNTETSGLDLDYPLDVQQKSLSKGKTAFQSRNGSQKDFFVNANILGLKQSQQFKRRDCNMRPEKLNSIYSRQQEEVPDYFEKYSVGNQNQFINQPQSNLRTSQVSRVTRPTTASSNLQNQLQIQDYIPRNLLQTMKQSERMSSDLVQLPRQEEAQSFSQKPPSDQFPKDIKFDRKEVLQYMFQQERPASFKRSSSRGKVGPLVSSLNPQKVEEKAFQNELVLTTNEQFFKDKLAHLVRQFNQAHQKAAAQKEAPKSNIYFFPSGIMNIERGKPLERPQESQESSIKPFENVAEQGKDLRSQIPQEKKEGLQRDQSIQYSIQLEINSDLDEVKEPLDGQCQEAVVENLEEYKDENMELSLLQHQNGSLPMEEGKTMSFQIEENQASIFQQDQLCGDQSSLANSKQDKKQEILVIDNDSVQDCQLMGSIQSDHDFKDNIEEEKEEFKEQEDETLQLTNHGMDLTQELSQEEPFQKNEDLPLSEAEKEDVFLEAEKEEDYQYHTFNRAQIEEIKRKESLEEEKEPLPEKKDFKRVAPSTNKDIDIERREEEGKFQDMDYDGYLRKVAELNQKKAFLTSYRHIMSKKDKRQLIRDIQKEESLIEQMEAVMFT